MHKLVLKLVGPGADLGGVHWVPMNLPSEPEAYRLVNSRLE